MNACIRQCQNKCPIAVIPSITVEDMNGIKGLADCFAHVASTNTTYYIDDKHRPMIIWAGPVEIDAYDIETNELGLRSQTCYTTMSGAVGLVEVYFDKRGAGHIMGTEA